MERQPTLSFVYSDLPLSAEDVFQDPYWIPETSILNPTDTIFFPTLHTYDSLIYTSGIVRY